MNINDQYYVQLTDGQFNRWMPVTAFQAAMMACSGYPIKLEETYPADYCDDRR